MAVGLGMGKCYVLGAFEKKKWNKFKKVMKHDNRLKEFVSIKGP